MMVEVMMMILVRKWVMMGMKMVWRVVTLGEALMMVKTTKKIAVS